MKIAFISPRYGAEIVDGAEHLCRLVAERLVGRHDIEVLTTCARDQSTWRNVCAEGADRLRGVVVRRFATAHERDADDFERRSQRLAHPHSRADEMAWLEQRGPSCPALIEYLRRTQLQYDVLVFFAEGALTTLAGLAVNPGKSVVVVTGPVENRLGLETYGQVFARPAALCFVTDSDRSIVRTFFRDRALLEEVVGLGVEVSPFDTYPRMPTAAVDEGPAPPLWEDDETIPVGSPYEAPVSSHLTSKGAPFRRRHRLPAPMVLHAGGVEPGSGCEELFEYFASYHAQGGEATLVFAGPLHMTFPSEPWLRFAGMLSEGERSQALAAATVVVCPAAPSSLSLVALEALACGTPILATARNSALVERCLRSNAGLWYASGDEFVEGLTLLTRDATLRNALGENGLEYARSNCAWDAVIPRYERVFGAVRHAR